MTGIGEERPPNSVTAAEQAHMGALDPMRKRMFMAMKREVLRLGGYEREFFISQTPELNAMADRVIDLDAMRADARADSGRAEATAAG